MRQHISKCALCRDHWETLSLVYKNIDEEVKSEPTQRDREFAGRLLAEEERLALPERGVVRHEETGLRDMLETYAQALELRRPSAVQRFIHWVKIHPVRFATASAFSLATLALLTITVTRTSRDPNPLYAEVKNAVLRVYNKEGEVLWSKPALKIPNGSTRFGFEHSYYGPKFATVDDIDGNGSNVLLITGLSPTGQHGLDSLYCFEGDGTLRWRIGAGKFATFGKKGVGLFGEPAFVSHLVLKERGTPVRLVALVGSAGFSPVKLIELDTRTGRELRAYHHRGGLSVLLAMDVDRDGKQELIVAGVNDGFNRACISALDPDRIAGHAPVPDELIPLEEIPEAAEKYYVLLPVSDLGKTRGRTPYSVINQGSVSGINTLVVHAQEHTERDSTPEVVPSVVYILGDSMRILNVTGSDPFYAIYRRHFPDKPDIKLDLAYRDALKDSVLYWNGDTFVHTPTMNKRYVAAKMLP